MGNAVKIAAEDARAQLLEVAADALKARVEDLQIEQGKVFATGNPEKRVPLQRS